MFGKKSSVNPFAGIKTAKNSWKTGSKIFTFKKRPIPTNTVRPTVKKPVVKPQATRRPVVKSLKPIMKPIMKAKAK